MPEATWEHGQFDANTLTERLGDSRSSAWNNYARVRGD